MTCVHLRALYEFCQENEVKLGSSDLIRIVCRQCQHEEDCPAVLTDEYDKRHKTEAQPLAIVEIPRT